MFCNEDEVIEIQSAEKMAKLDGGVKRDLEAVIASVVNDYFSKTPGNAKPIEIELNISQDEIAGKMSAEILSSSVRFDVHWWVKDYSEDVKSAVKTLSECVAGDRNLESFVLFDAGCLSEQKLRESLAYATDQESTEFLQGLLKLPVKLRQRIYMELVANTF